MSLLRMNPGYGRIEYYVLNDFELYVVSEDEDGIVQDITDWSLTGEIESSDGVVVALTVDASDAASGVNLLTAAKESFSGWSEHKPHEWRIANNGKIIGAGRIDIVRSND